MTFVYGKGPVLEVLRVRGRRVHRLFLAEGGGRDPRLDELRDLASRLGVRVESANRDELARRAEGRAHQGVLAEVDMLPRVELEDLLGEAVQSALVVVLDGVQDPQNLGAIVRTADCAGARCVVIAKDRAASLTPAAVKVAEGAAEHVPVVEVTNIARAIGTLKDAGLWCVGFEAEATRPWTQARLEGPAALVFGSEGEGMRRLVRESCDDLAAIPIRGGIPSLNVSMAVAVGLYEALRQRERAGRLGVGKD